MTMELKIVKIGNSVGVVLPKDMLARLRVELGDKLFVGEAPGGYMLSAADLDFVEAMTAAEGIMREDRDILAVLAR
ncbi:AbrB/MazE/SpoVT family DNA-binding domain-containing protein [Sphingomonas koreensis]|nr:AbrB/MazE/SpoVT family DNA-binding domain-containing protein [Sphingomonas koreensis]